MITTFVVVNFRMTALLEALPLSIVLISMKKFSSSTKKKYFDGSSEKKSNV